MQNISVLLKITGYIHQSIRLDARIAKMVLLLVMESVVVEICPLKQPKKPIFLTVCNSRTESDRGLRFAPVDRPSREDSKNVLTCLFQAIGAQVTT